MNEQEEDLAAAAAAADTQAASEAASAEYENLVDSFYAAATGKAAEPAAATGANVEEANATPAKADEGKAAQAAAETDPAKQTDPLPIEPPKDGAKSDAKEADAAKPPADDPVKKHIQFLEHAAKSARGRELALQRKLADLEKQVSSGAPAQKSADPDQAFAQLAEHFDGISPEAGNLLRQTFGPLMQEMQSLRTGQAQAMADQQKASDEIAKASAYSVLDVQHPGWKETVNSEAFAGWIQSQPRSVQAVFSDSDDLGEVSWLLGMYQRDVEVAKNAKAQREADRNKKLESAVGVPAKAGGDAARNIDYDTEVNAWYDKLTPGRR